MTGDSPDGLRERIRQLEQEIATLRQENARLQRANRASEVAETPIGPAEFEETLKRLVQRVSMILQAEKCAIMILDKENNQLVAKNPAFGIPDEDVKNLRIGLDIGLPGMVFKDGKAAIFTDSRDALGDDVKDLLHIRNGVLVPLVVEKRDDENRVLDRISIGLIGVFNKRYGGEFLEEDLTLLERLARNTASVIANAQMIQDLLEEQEKLVHTIESLYAGLLLISGTGRIMQMNARARQIFNVVQDPAGKSYAEVLKNESADALISRMLNAPEMVVQQSDDEEGKGAEEIAVVDSETEEERVFQVHPAPVRGEDGHLIGTAIILNDITELRNLERMKTEFVAIAAHELRTPMTPIKGFISMLAQDEYDSFSYEERKEYYSIIEQNVDRLGRLINDLLNVTRIERKVGLQLFWEEVNLGSLSESVFEIQRGMTNTERHSLVVDSVPDPVTATVGKDQMEQILQNLVSNAIKYSPEGGEVRIIIREEKETESVIVGVKDSGTGIPESAKSKLFKPYRRIHNPKTASVKGTGIGLFLVKNLVEAHSGTIWVDSELGKGTTFWFRIPKKPTEHAASESYQPA
jgi:Signal transduction histidine kinase